MPSRKSRSLFSDASRSPTTDPDIVHDAEFRFGRATVRRVRIQVGRRYIVSPLNPSAKKHRGRPCVIVELDDAFMPHEAAVQFTDEGGRIGKVLCGDLAEPGTSVLPPRAAELWDLEEIRERGKRLAARLADELMNSRLREMQTLIKKMELLKTSLPSSASMVDAVFAEVLGGYASGTAKASGREVSDVLAEVALEAKKLLMH